MENTTAVFGLGLAGVHPGRQRKSPLETCIGAPHYVVVPRFLFALHARFPANDQRVTDHLDAKVVLEISSLSLSRDTQFFCIP